MSSSQDKNSADYYGKKAMDVLGDIQSSMIAVGKIVVEVGKFLLRD